jgi:hypothetical protein
MTQIIKSRKERANFTIEQKLDYAKLMVNENYGLHNLVYRVLKSTFSRYSKIPSNK